MRKIPTHEIRLENVRVHIWASDPEDRELWFGVEILRPARNGKSWKLLPLQEDDLAKGLKVVDKAFDTWRSEQNERLAQLAPAKKANS